MICCEGLCGGAAYVNAFHRLATEEGQDEAGEEAEEAGFLSKDRLRIEQEKEFVRPPRFGYGSPPDVLTLTVSCSASVPSDLPTLGGSWPPAWCRVSLNPVCARRRSRADGCIAASWTRLSSVYYYASFQATASLESRVSLRSFHVQVERA